MAITEGMSSTTLTTALNHVYNVCQYGHSLVLIKSNTNDELGEELTEITLSLHAFPVRKKPFSRSVLETISWAENVDVIAFVSYKEVTDGNNTINTLKQYKAIRHDGMQYDITYVEEYSAFLGSFLYVVIGATK